MTTVNLTSTTASGFLETDFDLIKTQVDGLDTSKTLVSIIPSTTDDLSEGVTNSYDKTVSFTGGSNIIIGGTYPSFTITDNTINSIIDDTTPELGGELDAGAHSIGFTLQTATGDGTTTIDWTLGNKFKFTFGAFNETFTFTAPSNPCSLTLMLVQDATGSRTVTWPATVKWSGGTAPTLTTTANAIDIVSLLYDGTNFYGSAALDFS